MKDRHPAHPQEPDPKQEPVPSQELKRGRGRPEEKEWPEPIPDSPENIVRALMSGPPKKQWRYLKRHRNRDQ